MAKTQITDIIVPEVFNPYVTEQLKEQDAFVKSGIIVNNPELDKLALSGGKLINMPFFEDLDGDDEVLSDSGALTPAKITAAQDVAVLLMRGKAWSTNDLAKALSGDDPMAAIANLVVRYWLRKEQTTLFSILQGVFGASSMADNLYDISADATTPGFTGTGFITAKNKLGDNSNKLTAVAVHSQTYSYMEQQNLIDMIPNASADVGFGTYMQKTIIVDDDCPVSSDVFTTYLFGMGAIGKGEGAAPVPTETDRDSLAGDDILIHRRHYLLHPRGVKFTNSSVAGSSPTNTELATAANWERVYDQKCIRLVAFKHKLV
jgi:hypothetical protein